MIHALRPMFQVDGGLTIIEHRLTFSFGKRWPDWRTADCPGIVLGFVALAVNDHIGHRADIVTDSRVALRRRRTEFRKACVGLLCLMLKLLYYPVSSIT